MMQSFSSAESNATIPFIDTHAHLYGDDYASDLRDVISRARAAGATKLFLPATNWASVHEILDVCTQYPHYCFPMLGLHPEDISSDDDSVLLKMEQLLQQPNHPFIAIGEVGLDLYWDASQLEAQRRVFDTQIQWSLHYDLPLMIHARNAHQPLVDCLAPYKQKVKGVFHCFSGTSEEAEELLSFEHFMLGIGGVLTFKKSTLHTVLSSVPLNRLVLETDSPYLAPVPMRGKRNEPSNIPYIIDKLAEIYQVSPEEVARVTSQNAATTFPLAFK